MTSYDTVESQSTKGLGFETGTRPTTVHVDLRRNVYSCCREGRGPGGDRISGWGQSRFRYREGRVGNGYRSRATNRLPDSDRPIPPVEDGGRCVGG